MSVTLHGMHGMHGIQRASALTFYDRHWQSQLCVQERSQMACHRDPMLGERYALVRSEALLAERLDRLAHQG